MKEQKTEETSGQENENGGKRKQINKGIKNKEKGKRGDKETRGKEDEGTMKQEFNEIMRT